MDLDNLSDTQHAALTEIVHDQASQIASNVINSGGGVDYLLSNGWSKADIEAAIEREAGNG